MVDCPVDSCEYSAETENSVIAHASSSKGDHAGIGYQKAKQMLEVAGATSESDPDTDPDSSPDTGGDTDSGSDAPTFPEAEDAGASCPRCGGDVETFTEATRFQTSVNGVEGYATADVGDLHCPSCSIVVDGDTGEVFE